MSVRNMTKADLIGKIERDDAAVQRAAALIRDNADLQVRLAAANQRAADLQSKLTAAQKENADLQSRLDAAMTGRVSKNVIEKVHGRDVRDIERIASLKSKVADLEKTISEFWQSPKVKVIEK